MPACFYVFFPRMRGLFGVLQLANFAAMDCRACLFLCFFARMRVLIGLLQLVKFAVMDCLPVCIFFLSANARSFWGVAAMDCLPFAFYSLAGVSTATFNEFFLTGTLTAH